MTNTTSVEPPDGSGTGQSKDARIGLLLQGRYRILAPLAKGGMGTVYRAERLQLGRVVAIKFLHEWGSRDPQLVKRFEVEARAMSRLGHPNCVSVIDFGVEESPYLVMELITGKTLLETISEGIVPAARALAITRQVLAGLAHAHAHGIIHRDIKPENIVLEQTPGFEDHVRIVDFGLAKLLDSQTNLTHGLAVGTPNYMAPEQMGPGAVDGRTDVYAVGVVLFEMLTGRRPFQHDDIAEVFRRHLHMPPPPLRQASPREGYSVALEAVLLRAMAKTPDDRFATAAAFAAALDSVPEAGRASAAPPPVVTQDRASDVSGALEATVHAGSQGALTRPSAPNGMTAEQPILDPRTHPMTSWRVRVMGVATRLARRARPFLERSAGFVRRAGAQGKKRGRGLARLLLATGRRRMATGALLAGIASALIGIAALRPGDPREGEPAPDRPAVSPRPDPPSIADDSPGSAEVRALLRSGNRERAQRLLTDLRARHPADAELAALQAEIYFDKRWWSEGVASYRDVLATDPARAGDPVLVGYVISSLQSPRFHARAAAFLLELGDPARPFLEEAARQDDSPSVRSRATSLLQTWAARDRREDPDRP